MNLRDRGRALIGVCVGFGTTAAVLSPLLTHADDSFPISTYPMFARPRGQPTLYAAIGRAADGSERRLAPSLIGSAEVLQAKVLITRSVEQGPAATQAFCRGVAARVASSSSAAELRDVEIVRRRYDPIAYFVNGPAPLEQELVQSCPVPRPALERAAGGQ
jgi:hypothetical protein